MRRFALLLWLLVGSAQADDAIRLALAGAADMQFRRIDGAGIAGPAEPLPAGLRTPLGSLWKLFVHAWLLADDAPEQPYVCRGRDPDEVYCCEPGQSIAREQALLQSCGLYYAPARLGIDAGRWQAFWRAQGAPDWLSTLARLGPDTTVPVAELLAVLARLPQQARLRELLLEVALRADDGRAVAAFGGRLRVKTWSWRRDGRPVGGFAGWLADGRPIWLEAPGTSATVFRDHAEAIAAALPTAAPAEAGDCVEVAMFARYPIAAVLDADGRPAAPGPLRGRYTVHFENGNRLPIASAGELLLADGRPTVSGRFDREDYVARVLEREGAAQPVEAARALAITIRSYLQQHAERDADCLRIDDSSARQRVAAHPPSPAVQAVVAWTADLVLAGQPVRYHHDRAAPGVLGWLPAVAAAGQGARFDLLLARAFPRADLARWGRPEASCQPLPEAERWLADRQRRWRPQLAPEPGYEALTATVCRLLSGRPHVDRARRRIYVRALSTLQDRLDLTHEYLHLAFDAHPNGQDEAWVEALARHLLLE